MTTALPSGSASDETSGRRKKILLVDDNEGTLLAMTLLLKREDLQSETAEDGEKAIELLKEKPFDLVLTDVDMPNVGGFEVLEWVQKNKPEIPVILMSGSAAGESGQTARLALQRGAKGVIAKPFTMGALEKAVANALR